MMLTSLILGMEALKTEAPRLKACRKRGLGWALVLRSRKPGRDAYPERLIRKLGGNLAGSSSTIPEDVENLSSRSADLISVK